MKEIVVGRDYGDRYPDGIIITEIYGKMSLADVEDIQKMFNDREDGISLPPDLTSMSTECNTTEVKCSVWWNHDSKMWDFNEEEYIVDGVVYPTIEEYTTSHSVLWNKLVAKNAPTIPFVMVSDKATKVELDDDAEVELHEYMGIKFITHRVVENHEFGDTFVSTDFLTGCVLPEVYYRGAPDRVRAIARFHDEVDRIGVLRMYAQVSKTLDEVHDIYPISIGEWFAGGQ